MGFADEVSYFLYYLFVYSVIWFLFCVAGCEEVSQLFVFCLVCYLCGRVCGGEVVFYFCLNWFYCLLVLVFLHVCLLACCHGYLLSSNLQ